MRKSCTQQIIFYIILVYILHLQACDEDQSQIYLSMWPTHQINTVAHLQANFNYDQPQQNYFNLITPQNSGFTLSSSGQDWYQQHRRFILNNARPVLLQGKIIRITPEDIQLINRICADNPHRNPDELRRQLAASSAFNYTQHFYNGDKELHAFTPDIYINPAHFKTVSASKHRIAKLEKAAKDAIEDWYYREKSNLNANSKVKSQDTEKLKTELVTEYKRKKKYPLGDKQYIKTLVNPVKKTANPNQVTQQAPPQQVVKKSNISSQEIQKEVAKQDQKLGEQNNPILKVHNDKNSSYQQVMDKRSKAFTSSINNPTPVIELIKINSQTTAFLQAHGIDTIQFQQIEGLSIQHQLTHEFVEVSDLVKRGIGLENLSYDEIDLIARTVKRERNIDIHRSGDLSKVNVKFTDNSNICLEKMKVID